jgi:membrane fusion protein, heavy metal efflux system
MNRLIILWIAALTFSCQRGTSSEEEHGHPHEPETTTLAYTLYSDKTELFVEFKPLVVGRSSRFAAHFTKLGDNFTALDEGTITLSLTVNDKGIRTTTNEPSNPGIFRLALKPVVAGKGKLVFDIKTTDYTDRITIDDVTVYPDSKSAESVEVVEPEGGAISFLKEQAWKIEFANQEVMPQAFHEVIKVSGQLLARPTDEQIVTARSNGVVKWNENVIPGAAVRQGQKLFVLTSGNLAQGNIESQYREAKANYEKAEADYKRVQPLLADKIISQKDYLEIKNRYDQSRIAFETLSRNYSEGGQAVTTPMNGFISQIMIASGEYVQAGQPLAVITRSQSLQLKAEVPLRYSNQLPLINEARFRTLHDDQVYSTRELNGKVLSYGKSVGSATSLLPIYFSLSNNGKLIPGDAVEVYLKSTPIENALVVPLSSLIEEQGNFYVYVQIAGESFQKRPVKPGAQDGAFVQILSGIKAGERVVTKGAYLVKLATQSGAVPAHGHEH